MSEQFIVKPCGGSINHDDKPQEIAGRNPERCGGYVANNSDRVLHLFMGEAIELQPYRGVMLGAWKGPVTLTGKYTQRFAAVQFVKDTAAC